jgi:hypothetical protein
MLFKRLWRFGVVVAGMVKWTFMKRFAVVIAAMSDRMGDWMFLRFDSVISVMVDGKVDWSLGRNRDRMNSSISDRGRGSFCRPANVYFSS